MILQNHWLKCHGMRLPTDAQLFTPLARDARDASRRRMNDDAAQFARQASISDAYNRSAAPAKAVAPVTKQQALSETKDRTAADSSSPRREAPMGQRPKFIPKGQTINLLV
jgi:hypothetical protein